MSTRAQAAMPSMGTVRGGLLQRKCSCGGNVTSGGECEACKKKKQLQRRATETSAPDVAPPIVHDVLRSPGQPLDAASRAYFEPRFGYDFSKVRIHADAKAAESATAVHASAYTVGSGIAFAGGQYKPHSADGRQLLAHELTHVVQQGGESASGSGPLRVGPAASAAETEATAMARSIAAAPAPVAAKPGGAGVARLMRQTAPGADPSAAPPPTNDDLTIQTAQGTSTMEMLSASASLGELGAAVKGQPNSPQANKTAAAVSRWLNVELNDPAFGRTVDQARTALMRALAVKTKVIRVPDTDPDCAGAIAVSYGSAALNIHVCKAFFSTNDRCRADALTHEYLHLIGLHHGNEKRDAQNNLTSPEDKDKESTAEALDSADAMAQMVAQIVRGTTGPACLE